MAANVYLKSFALGAAEYVPLADTRLVLNATLIASAQNLTPISVRRGAQTPASWPPGARVFFEQVDLSQLEVQGPAGTLLLVVGYSR